MDFRFQYWKNVLGCRAQNTTLILEELNNEEKEFIKNNQLCKFYFFDNPEIESNNIVIRKRLFIPGALRDINYCLYRGNDAEILLPVLSSGITIINNIEDTLNLQEKLERVNNFEAAKEFDKK